MTASTDCTDAGESAGASSGTFVLTHRSVVALVSIVLFAPTILFASTLRAPAAALVYVGCLGALFLTLRRERVADPSFLDARVDLRLLLGLILASGLLLIAGGALHFVYAPFDWRTRDAVLADISRDWFPVLYRQDGVDYLLRAPLGMYMLPGLAGRSLGLLAAHVAMWLQNSLLLGAILYVFARIGRGWPHALVMLAYSGCAALGAGIYCALSEKSPLSHMFRSGVDAWNPYFQYSGSLVQLFWVPNHALPGWWLAALILLQSRQQVSVATLGAAIGGAMFWSPLAVLPAVLWTMARGLIDIRASMSPRGAWPLALIAPCFAPIAYYMVAGASSIAHEASTEKPLFFVIYAMLMVACLAPVAYIVVCRQSLPPWAKAPVLFSVLVLVALPFYSFGPSNDLVMRGSISALTIIAFAFGAVLLAPESRRDGSFRVGLAILLACLPSALFELTRSTLRDRYAISDCTLFEANAAMHVDGVSTNYVVERDHVPGWLVDLTATPRRVAAARGCWSDGGEPEVPADQP